jgi:hypothetical protein
MIGDLRGLASDRDQAPITRRKGRTEPEIMKKQIAGVLYNSWSHGTGILLDPGRTLCFGSFIDRQKLTRGRLVGNDTTLGENLFGDRHRFLP